MIQQPHSTYRNIFVLKEKSCPHTLATSAQHAANGTLLQIEPCTTPRRIEVFLMRYGHQFTGLQSSRADGCYLYPPKPWDTMTASHKFKTPRIATCHMASRIKSPGDSRGVAWRSRAQVWGHVADASGGWMRQQAKHCAAVRECNVCARDAHSCCFLPRSFLTPLASLLLSFLNFFMSRHEALINVGCCFDCSHCSPVRQTNGFYLHLLRCCAYFALVAHVWPCNIHIGQVLFLPKKFTALVLFSYNLLSGNRWRDWLR